MRLDVSLVHRLGAELAFDHDIRLAKPCVQVAKRVEIAVRHVSGLAGVSLRHQSAWPNAGIVEVGQPFVNQRGIVPHRLQNVGDRGQYLVLDLY